MTVIYAYSGKSGARRLDDPGSPLGCYWPRFAASVRGHEAPGKCCGLKLGRTKPHRQRDLVVRGEKAFPPRLALAAAGHLGEKAQAVVLPLLDRVEVARVVLDQRLDERAAVADVPRLVADARPMIHRGEHVAARLGTVRQHGERAGARRALGHEVAFHEDLDRVLELEQVTEEPAGRPRRFPRGEP